MSYYVITSFALGDTQGVVADIGGAQSDAEFVGTSFSGNAVLMAGSGDATFIGSTLAFESYFNSAGSSGLTAVGEDGITFLFLNYFEGTAAASGPFTDEESGITWTVDNDGGSTTFVALDKFGSTSAYIPGAFPGFNTLECGDFTDLTNRSWTVEGWINFEGGENLTNAQFGVGKISSHTSQISMNVNLTSDLMGCEVKLASNLSGVLATGSSINLSQDIWYHMAFQYDLDNDNYECYFNGVRYIQYNGQGDVGEPDNDFLITHNMASVGIRIGEVRGSLGLRYSGATYSVPTASF